MKKIFLLFISSLFVTSCAQQSLENNQPTAPTQWYDSLKQNPPQAQGDDENFEDPEKLKALAESVDTIFSANAEALEEGDLEAQTLLSPLAVPMADHSNKPKDWVPWRAEYFMSDLSLTAGGHIGVLALRGTTTVRAYWRRQGPKENKTMEFESTEQSEGPSEEPTIEIQADMSEAQLVKQLEPAIHAAVATKKVKDTPELRKTLLNAAQDFQAIATAIPTQQQNLPWWVSRFRLDVMIDAAGRAEPIGLAGGEVRFRFEWFRLRRTQKAMMPMTTLSERTEKIRKSLATFINGTANDLEMAFSNHNSFGFKAHQMRMGLGISAKGNIGVVKGAATIVGQIYFTRNVQRPVVRPRTLELKENEEPILIIDRNPAPAEMAWATQHGISYETNTAEVNSSAKEVTYKIDRSVFRKGLKKASRIGAFFAQRAAKVKPGAWKIYELRTAFDASLGGGIDLVTLAGTGTAQISMWNENF